MSSVSMPGLFRIMGIWGPCAWVPQVDAFSNLIFMDKICWWMDWRVGGCLPMNRPRTLKLNFPTPNLERLWKKPKTRVRVVANIQSFRTSIAQCHLHWHWRHIVVGTSRNHWVVTPPFQKVWLHPQTHCMHTRQQHHHCFFSCACVVALATSGVCINCMALGLFLGVARHL